jgi:hypothetical protein
MTSADDVIQGRIRDLNDQLRTTARGGNIVVTQSLVALGPEFVAQAVCAVVVFSDFTPDNDPYGEHDFGAVTVGGESLFFKIDYYDLALTGGSPDPANAAITRRVMTVMLAADY